MSLTDNGGGDITLIGAPGAVLPPGGRVRVTAPAVRVETALSSEGEFSATLTASIDDVFYLEYVRAAGGGVFLAAVQRDRAGMIMAVDAGLDTDGDESPDAVDCAPRDPDLRSRECAPVAPLCPGGTGCVGGTVCVGGYCLPPSCVMNETCDNGLDDDCNGIVDDCS